MRNARIFIWRLLGSHPKSRPWLRTFPNEFTVPRWIRILLALSELLGGIMAPPALVTHWDDTPGQGPGGWLIPTYILSRPILALAGLAYVRKGRLLPTLYCMAAIAILEWANMIPSVALHGLQVQEAGPAWRVALIFGVFIKPAIAVATAVLAATRVRPIAAGMLAIAPTIFGWIGVAAFAASVAVHGF